MGLKGERERKEQVFSPVSIGMLVTKERGRAYTTYAVPTMESHKECSFFSPLMVCLEALLFSYGCALREEDNGL